MNAIFGGIGTECFAYLLFIWTQHLSISIGGAAILCFSRAYSINAVDMTEPMVGSVLVLFASALISCFVTRFQRRSLIIAASFCTAIGACGILRFSAPDSSRRSRLINVGLYFMTTGILTLGIYVSAFLIFGGATSIMQAFSMGLHRKRYDAWHLQRVQPAPSMPTLFGLVDALFGLRGIDGEGVNLFGMVSTLNWGHSCQL